MSGTDYTQTPNLGLYKPNYNLDVDNWGQHLNDNADILDSNIADILSVAYLPIAGGTLTGPLQTPAGTAAAPALALGRASDGLYAPALGNLAITLGGTPVFSTSAITARFMIPLMLQADPTAALGAATKEYVDNNAGAVTIGDAAPASPRNGALWWSSTDGQLYIQYADPNSSQWVVANSQPNGIPDAPSDANTYGRHAGAWAQVAPLSSVANNVGRNLVHNSLFNVAQRGVGPWTATGYTLDRWQGIINLDTTSYNQTTVNDALRSQIGDEQANFVFGATVAGNAAAGAFSFIRQPIEDMRRLAGKTVIVSFWAWCSAGTPKLGVSLDQVFGTGGSPSATVSGTGQAVTVGTVPTRYAVALVIPSIAGKTLGTNNDHRSILNLWFSAGASNNTTSGGVGVQTATFALWGVQLEIAQPGQTQPTPLEKPDPQQDLAKCQRFYQVAVQSGGGYANPGTVIQVPFAFPQQMRAVPTITVIWGTNTNLSPAVNPSSVNSGVIGAPMTGSAAGQWGFNANAINLTADL